MSLSIVILAAGEGKRMRSKTPKILHHLGGVTLIEHVIATVNQLKSSIMPIIVYGFQGEAVRHKLAHINATWIEQKEQKGTGHAVLQALSVIPEKNRVLILNGDVPLISLNTLQKLLTTTPDHALGLITATLPDPYGFGRIIRNPQQDIIKIIEEKEATAAEKNLCEINAGIYLTPSLYLKKWLNLLKKDNTQQEYYLTDIIHQAVTDKMPIHSIQPQEPLEVLGVNDQLQLMQLERYYQKKMAEKLLRQGVRLMDANRFDLRGELIAGQDVVIDINVIIEGRVTLGNHCIIGPHTILRNVSIGHHVEIKAHSILDGVEIADHAFIGPFARLRPGSRIAAHAEIGNFIEIKNSLIGEYTKVHHLGYIGDSELGKRVNIGAGTITCNYDGVNKHKTIIGDNAFIGSNTELVAPVTVGEGATIGAGSTITRDAAPHQLTLSRIPQRTISDWQKKKKKKEDIKS